jgi:hypothetical protein
MLVKESGPLAVFDRLRALLAKYQMNPGGFYDMISCLACTSIYVSAVTALWVAGSFGEWIGYTLSFSAIAVLIERVSSSES